MCCVYTVNVYFMMLTKNCCFPRERSSRNRRVDIKRVWCHWKRKTSLKYHLRVSVQGVAFTLCECVFHDFDQKLLFSSGEVFSEQASRYQTSVVSLEAQNILEVPFKGLSSMCCVYFCVNVYFMILTKNCCFRRGRSSRNRRVDIRRVWCHWKRRTS